MKAVQAIPAALLGLLVVAVGDSSSEAGAPQDELEAPYQKYCAFVENEEWNKGIEVATSLDQQGKDILLEMAVAGNEDMQLCAWMLLSEVQDRRVVPIIAEFIRDSSKDPEERDSACELFKGFATVDALPALLLALSEPLDHNVNAGLHSCAIRALGSIDNDGAREKLRQLLGSSIYIWARSRIITSLGRLRDTGAVPVLIVIAQGPIGDVGEKWAATEALAAIGTPESVAPLLEIIQSMPAGSRRYDVGITVAHELEAARDRTQDAAFRTELEQLIPAIRALAKERPVQ